MSAPRPENMRSPLKAWLHALEATAPIERGQAPILPLLIDPLAERFDAPPALLARDVPLSSRALAQAGSRYPRRGPGPGLKAGAAAGRHRAHCPASMAICPGLAR